MAFYHFAYDARSLPLRVFQLEALLGTQIFLRFPPHHPFVERPAFHVVGQYRTLFRQPRKHLVNRGQGIFLGKSDARFEKIIANVDGRIQTALILLENRFHGVSNSRVGTKPEGRLIDQRGESFNAFFKARDFFFDGRLLLVKSFQPRLSFTQPALIVECHSEMYIITCDYHV